MLWAAWKVQDEKYVLLRSVADELHRNIIDQEGDFDEDMLQAETSSLREDSCGSNWDWNAAWTRMVHELVGSKPSCSIYSRGRGDHIIVDNQHYITRQSALNLLDLWRESSSSYNNVVARIRTLIRAQQQRFPRTNGQYHYGSSLLPEHMQSQDLDAVLSEFRNRRLPHTKLHQISRCNRTVRIPIAVNRYTSPPSCSYSYKCAARVAHSRQNQ